MYLTKLETTYLKYHNKTWSATVTFQRTKKPSIPNQILNISFYVSNENHSQSPNIVVIRHTVLFRYRKMQKKPSFHSQPTNPTTLIPSDLFKPSSQCLRNVLSSESSDDSEYSFGCLSATNGSSALSLFYFYILQLLYVALI